MRNIQVRMGFTADTTQAQSAIQQLQSSLQSIATTKVNVQGGSIDQAVQSAKQLSQHLAAATNVNTGKIDFSALQTSLKAANTDLTTLTNNLLAMGPKGQQAFSQVANAVAHAELSVKKTNSALASFGVTLMNTIKWQAASTMIHGAMSAFSDAVQHIEKLDKALNDIRIVTGKTASEMGSFAKRAQELSQSLSSTTEEYSKAALIFYQQGLGEKEVLDRTEATIKMAKVVGESVETVSDQLTAIWNNFSDGSKSLEYYVDVITALGAATASSTDEISDGLQKFAAIAETVGLSYEYAATALATITSETRQSADVVGTALKTLFARMEGLKLGETLEDGTTLNQYSSAMAKVGINIKDANGNLKEMDTILDEMGARWQTLNKDQQVALAQQVGGIRQYNQLIALMDNWDTFKINLEVAEDSEGTLTEQFAIYQDSIEASEKALQNAKETLYETLFNSDMLKDFNNGLADVLEIITRIVEKAGGLQGVLKFGGLLLLKTLLPQLMGFVTKITGSISTAIGLTKGKQVQEVGKMAQTERRIAGMPQEEKQFNKIGLRRQESPKPSTLKVKTDTLPIGQVDSSATAGDMSIQIQKEQAGYTAAILEAKKEYLMIEDQLTEKQKEQYKNYEAQINAENDLLQKARERQLLSKENADQTTATASAAVKSVVSEDELEELRAREVKKQVENSGAKAEMDAAKAKFVQEQTELAEEGKRFEKPSGRIEGLRKSSHRSEKEQAELDEYDQSKAAYEAKKRKSSDDFDAAQKKYRSTVQDIEEVVYSDTDIAKKKDFGGEQTEAAAASMASEASRKRKVKNVDTGDVTEVQSAQSATMEDMQGQLTTGDNGGIAVSVENLEKLGSLQGQYNADAQVAVDLQGELSTAIGVAGDKAAKGTKAYEQGNKSLKQAGTFAQKYSKQVGAAADEMAASGKFTEKQIQAVRTLAKEGAQVDLENMDPQDLAAIQAALKKVEGGLKTAGGAAGQMADGMAEDLANATGKTKDTFTAVSDGTRQLAEASVDAEQAVGRVHSAAEKPMPVQPDIYGGFIQGAQGAMQAVTGLAMGTQMLQMGLQTAFDPDATGIEKLTGLMMTMQGVQSLLTAAQGAYNVVLGLGNIIAGAAQIIREKGMLGLLKEIGLKYLDTAATIVNAVAKVFNAEASKGLAGVILGVVATALLLGTFFMVKNTMATEENTEAAQEEAKAQEDMAKSTAEAAKAAREEMDAINELTDSYLEALKVYEETGEKKDELNAAAFEAVSAMEIEGGAVDVLAGNYARLTQKIKEYNAAKVGKAIEASDASLASGAGAFLSKEALDDTDDAHVGMKSITGENGQAYLALSLGHSAGKDENALHRWLAANPDSPWEFSNGMVRAPYSSASEIAWLMSEFYKMVDGVSAIATTGEMQRMEFFKSVQQMRESGTFEQGQELATAYTTHVDTAITGAKSMYLGADVDTQEEYDAAYEKLIQTVLDSRGITDRTSAEAKQLIQTLQENLSKDEDFQTFEVRRLATQEYTSGKYAGTDASKYLEKDSEGKSKLTEWADSQGLTEDEAFDFFIKINPQYMTDSGIEEALDNMQKYVEANKIIVQIEAVTDAKSLLKETMTSEDWQNFYTEAKELFDPKSKSYIGMSFEEFTNQSHAQRVAILENAQKSLGTTSNALKEQAESERNALTQLQESHDGYVNEMVEEVRTEAETSNTALVNEIKTAGAVHHADYTNADYIYEATAYQNAFDKNGVFSLDKLKANLEAGGGSYDDIQDWIDEHGDFDSVEAYLAEKVKYLQANNLSGFKESDLEGYTVFNEDSATADAEKTYNAEVAAKETAITELENQAHLATLKEADEAIETYELDAEEVYNTANALQDMALASDEVADGLNEDAAAAKAVAVEIARFNKAVESIADSYEDWTDALASGNLSAITKATSEMRGMYANLLDMDSSDFSTEFLQDAKNLELAYKAASGDVKAYNDLQVSALAYLGQEWQGYASDVVTVLQQIAAIEGIDVGEKLYYNDSEQNDIAVQLADSYTRAYQAAIDGGAAVAEAQAYAANLINQAGFNIDDFGTEMEQRTVTITGDLPPNWTPVEGGKMIGPDGQEIAGVQWTSEEGGKYTYTQTYTVPKGMTFSKKAETFGGDTSKLTGGGGSSKKAEPTRKADVVERYKEINDRIADQEKAMDKASKAADRLWGPNRIQALKDANDALEKNIDLLKDKRAEAEYNLKQDKDALKDAISKNAGITVTDAMFDENGNFTSYNEVLNGLYDELKREEDAAGSEWSESEQKRIEAIQERIDAVKEAIENYDETNTLIKDLDTEIQDAIYEWQDNNYEVLNVELEYELEINEKELEIVDYYLGKMEGDLYSYIEAMGQYNEQSAIYTDNLGQQEAYVNKLTEAYKKGEISEQAYKEGLASSQSAIISNLQSLEESKQAMQDYYGNVMEMAIEEIGIYTSEMEQLNSVLDHYSNIMEMVGKQDDFATKDKILTSKANNIKNELAVQSELYKRSSTEAEHWAKKMSEAVVGSNEYETYKKNWQAAQQAANEAQDAMLSKTEEWAEAMKAIVENELADFAATMEEQLTGGTSFDEMLTSMERRSSLQEEYLTTTNKIYETNKLMRTAQQEIDKTSNAAAKRRLQNFINETNQLQNQTKLSQYELDIQQAKYDLLLAEIALEEAQNAKSTVRLSRDSEGNFGYVYTADSAAISEAEQNLADKQNALYNIGLEGANDYQQKYAETLQESQDAITELTQMWMNGEIASEEEFNRRKQEIIEYYGEKLEQYSDLHSVALSADSRVVADAWSSDFTGMMATTGEWQAAVDGYFQSAAGSMQTWAQVCKETLATSGLNDVDGALKNIDDKSKALITTLLGEDGESGLVGAMMDQVDAASKISESQTTIQNAIDKTIEYFENLLIAINNAYTAMTTPVTPAISTEGGTYNPDGSYTTSGNGTGNGSGNGSTGGNSGYDNQGYSEDKVKQAQGIVGVSQDGKWGPKSQAAAKTYCGSTKIADVFKKWKDSLEVPKDDDPPTTPVTPIAFDSNPVVANGLRNIGGGRPWAPGFAPVSVAFDTGGYTGAWGSYGKLAVLHEKELVLNKQQTENMLNAMDLLDHILQMIDLQSASAQLGGILSSPHFSNMNTSALEQSVHIEASFPGVQDRNEIEEAFNNLINKASQYAYRK